MFYVPSAIARADTVSSTYFLFAADVFTVGVFATVADVKAAVDGVVAPIVVLSIVVVFIGPTIFPLTLSTNNVLSSA